MVLHPRPSDNLRSSGITSGVLGTLPYSGRTPDTMLDHVPSVPILWPCSAVHNHVRVDWSSNHFEHQSQPHTIVDSTPLSLMDSLYGSSAFTAQSDSSMNLPSGDRSSPPVQPPQPPAPYRFLRFHPTAPYPSLPYLCHHHIHSIHLQPVLPILLIPSFRSPAFSCHFRFLSPTSSPPVFL